ncbi:hypothetical protein [uncultured Salinibacterium sp.]|uniref:hypothetical protein n=1 Tax=uncultured Salinibacterium sp. TaxID=459274 RepID=UPI0030D8E0AD
MDFTGVLPRERTRPTGGSRQVAGANAYPSDGVRRAERDRRDMVSGVDIATDPFVYAVGAKLASGGSVTAVVDRENLPFITLEFATRNQQK